MVGTVQTLGRHYGAAASPSWNTPPATASVTFQQRVAAAFAEKLPETAAELW
ncbi:hypothetical protein KQY30_35795 [Streptomyces sp. GMY02]|uniref:hypothetical protein n=1 Tax=Streptomyces sp. GMY02 TaxID=1333528 RepID=UPI001C2C7B00|nr:hypothetical protein [Streptomyces sp. GMY02]QXE38772.1 hypothetical protein KQY30_35795 [Streptomyces sp. GMY02]